MADEYGDFPAGNWGNQSFDWSEYLQIAEESEEDPSSPVDAGGQPEPLAFSSSQVDDSQVRGSSSRNNGIEERKVNLEVGFRVAFRTRTELDVLDDGYKWRKYGKKQVKNSPNPRNYYRCSVAGCPVKKRVERDPGDTSYVITTYEGIHNHESRPPTTVLPQMPSHLLPRN